MKKKILIGFLSVATMVASMSTAVFAADVIGTKTGTIYNNRYSTTAKLTWEQTTGSLKATTSCSGSGAQYSTGLMSCFTYKGVIVEGPVTASGTTSAKISRAGYGYNSAVSDHTVWYGNDEWTARISD